MKTILYIIKDGKVKAMSLNGVIYPYNIDARKLPLHLTGIGGTEWQQYILRPEGYQWHQIFYSECGAGILKYDNISVTVKAGEFFFLPAGYPHEYFAEGERWGVKFVTFDGYAASHILSILNMTKPIIIQPADSSVLTRLFDEMYSAQTLDRLHGDFTCSGLVYDYVLEFHRHMNDKANRVQSERSKLLKSVMDYIDAHLFEDLPLTLLSDIAGVTPQHLCRIFRESVNMRPKEYVTKKRLRVAKRLLQETEKTVAEISSKSGFSEPAYFCSVFKKYEKVSPLEYRKMRR